METAAPNRVVLLFALSEQGRRDAFRQGVSLAVDLDDPESTFRSDVLMGRHPASFCWREIDSIQEPELFERAAALESELDYSGSVATVPIGTGYTDSNDFWRVDHSDPNSLLPHDEGPGAGRSPFLTLSRIPQAPQERPVHLTILRHTVRAEHVQLDTYEDLDDYHSSDPEEFEFHFEPFDYYPSTEQLIATEESNRAAAVEQYSSFVEEEAALRASYALWLEQQRTAALSALDQSESDQSAAGVALPESDVANYRKRLETLSTASGDYVVSAVLGVGPALLNRELREAQEAATKALTLAVIKEWVEAYGSARLQRIAREGMLSSSLSVYRDERLAAERPGWAWKPLTVQLRDPAAPDEDEFALLDRAREVDADAKLRFATLGKGKGCFVAVSRFLDRDIWYPADALEQIEGAER